MEDLNIPERGGLFSWGEWGSQCEVNVTYKRAHAKRDKMYFGTLSVFHVKCFLNLDEKILITKKAEGGGGF